MCERFVNKYGFEYITNIGSELCSSNFNIVPKLWRYRGLEIWEVIAEVRGVSNKFFLFDISIYNDEHTHDSIESNRSDVDELFNDMKSLTVEDSMDIEEIHSILKKRRWYNINPETGDRI